MKIIPLDSFNSQTEKLLRKYPSILNDLEELFKSLNENPRQGNALGKGCYKIRLAIESKNTGKSGGARVITCVKVHNDTIFLLSIFDKSEQATISDSDLKALLKQIE